MKSRSALISRMKHVQILARRITMSCLGNDKFYIRVERDNENVKGRIFVQVCYYTHCIHLGEETLFKGRKFYLSDHMLDDEIVKTIYLAFKLAVEHEMMEGFKVDGIVMVNPHTPFTALLKASATEVSRNKKNA